MSGYTVEYGGKKYNVGNAESASQIWAAIRDQAGETGAIITDPSGKSQFVSNAYSSTDPEQIARIREQNMTAGQASRRSIMESVVADDPIMARSAAAIQAVPFAGEYADELLGALGQGGGQDAMRLAQKAMAETRPKETLGLQVGTGIASTLPLAALATAARGSTLAYNALRGLALGGAGGAAEGFVSGYGAGETPDERMLNAQQRALMGGAFGAALGGLSPLAGLAVGGLRSLGPKRTVTRAAEQLGLSPEAAQIVAAGSSAAPSSVPTRPMSLAESDLSISRVLDEQMSTPHGALRQTMGILNRQAAKSSADLKTTLDTLMGPPRGVGLQQRDLMQATAAERAAKYDAAYMAPIDTSSAQYRTLEALLKRVDQDVIDKAKTLANREGIDPDNFMVQVDYITRDLRSRATTFGAAPEDVKTFSGLASVIRQEADKLVPEYAAARDFAADVIGDREALDAGYKLLSGTMKREDVQMLLEGMTDSERANVASGMRQWIDDVMARASSPLDPEGAEYKEALTALNKLQSREMRDKMAMALGQDGANAVRAKLAEIIPTISTRMGAVGAGTQTAGRKAAREQTEAIVSRGFRGDITGEARRRVADVAGAGVPTVPQQVRDLYSETAPFLATQVAPPQFANMQRLLQSIPPATRRALEMQQAGIRGGAIAGLAATPAMQTLARYLGASPDVRGGRR
jgi:hypothetical protein